MNKLMDFISDVVIAVTCYLFYIVVVIVLIVLIAVFMVYTIFEWGDAKL